MAPVVNTKYDSPIKPQRHGNFWSVNEVDDLLWEWCAGLTINQIAEHHERLYSAIECRLVKEGFMPSFAEPIDASKEMYIGNIDPMEIKRAYLEIYIKIRDNLRIRINFKKTGEYKPGQAAKVIRENYAKAPAIYDNKVFVKPIDNGRELSEPFVVQAENVYLKGDWLVNKGDTTEHKAHNEVLNQNSENEMEINKLLNLLETGVAAVHVTLNSGAVIVSKYKGDIAENDKVVVQNEDQRLAVGTVTKVDLLPSLSANLQNAIVQKIDMKGFETALKAEKDAKEAITAAVWAQKRADAVKELKDSMKDEGSQALLGAAIGVLQAGSKPNRRASDKPEVNDEELSRAALSFLKSLFPKGMI